LPIALARQASIMHVSALRFGVDRRCTLPAYSVAGRGLHGRTDTQRARHATPRATDVLAPTKPPTVHRPRAPRRRHGRSRIASRSGGCGAAGGRPPRLHQRAARRVAHKENEIVNRSIAANQALDVARSNADARDPILLPDEGAYHQELTARGVQFPVPPVRLVVAVRRSRRQPLRPGGPRAVAVVALHTPQSVGPVRPRRMPTNRPEPPAGRSRPQRGVVIVHPTPSEVESSW
jgi:hypothetical protein